MRKFMAIGGAVAMVVGILSVAAPQASATGALALPAHYVAVPTTRLLDTRVGTGAPKRIVRAGSVVTLAVSGHGGVPASGVSAAVLNVTAAGETGTGHVTVYPWHANRPSTSNLNFVKGQAIANSVVALLGPNGKIELYVSTDTQLVVDLSGYYATSGSAAAGTMQPVVPTRLLDTRVGTGARKGVVRAGSVVALSVAGHAGVPASGVSAVVLNVTATGEAGTGHVTVYPGQTSRPSTSSLNFVKGRTIANNVIAQVGTNGKINLFVSADTHLLADVSAFYLSGTTMTAGATQATAPTRLLDTRVGTGARKGIVRGGSVVALSVAGHGGVPATGVSAVVLNVTAIGEVGTGHVTVYPGLTARPSSSSLNFVKGQAIANNVIARVGRNGKINLDVSAATHLLADVNGYVRKANSSWAPADTVDPTRGGPDTLSCATSTFCVAGDRSGAVTTFDGESWSQPTSVTSSTIISISCATTTDCAALTDSAAVTSYDGAAWSTAVPLFNSSSIEGAISCPTAAFCMAVGDQSASSRAAGTWAQPAQIESPNGGELTGVSCATASACVAVDSAGYAVAYSAGTWGTAASVFAGQLGTPASVACATDTHCVAVQGRFASTFDGTSWTTPVSVASAGTALTSITCPSSTACHAYGNGNEFTSSGSSWSEPTAITGLSNSIYAACPTDSFCAAIDSNGNAATSATGTWSSTTPADPSAGSLSDVSCPLAASCTAVDLNGSAIRFDGTSWSHPVQIEAGAAYWAVSCPTTTFCAAVGSSNAGPANTGGTAAIYQSGAWSAVPIDDQDTITDVSCPTALFCEAVDVSGHALSWQAGQWNEPTDVFHASPAGSEHPIGLQCLSDHFCLAANDAGSVWTFDGSSWKPAAVPADADALSCRSPNFCVLITSVGRMAVYNGTTWSYNPNGPTFSALRQPMIDCRSAIFCAAAATGFNPSLFDGQGIQPVDDPTGSPPDTVNTQVAVSCATTTTCVAVGGAYARSWRR